MESRKRIEFNELAKSDLIVDANYKAGSFGDVRDDPLSKLMGCGNQGGFRIVGNSKTREYILAVIYSTLDDPDWPDRLDTETGSFVYYGDNKSPGYELHDTPRKGNSLLRYCFDAIHKYPSERVKVPPFFIFTKGTEGRDVIFRGLAAPGSSTIRPTEDLVSIWKTTRGQRFQNYKAVFTVLNVSVIPRAWIMDLQNKVIMGENCPGAWRCWVEEGKYDALRAEPTITYRRKSEQLPSNARNRQIVNCIYEYFKNNPFEFERCAAEIFSLMDENVTRYDVMGHWRDGGRDAMGLYRVGSHGDNIKVEFALEAKCFRPGIAVGVRYTSRLISRLRYRQFGILVTTSYVDQQAYKEIREDRHPVIVIAAEDIANILVDAGMGTKEKVLQWLRNNFPI